MSTLTETAAAIVTYYVVVFGGREIMRNREPLKLKGPGPSLCTTST